MRILDRSGLDALIAALGDEGLEVLAPVERDGVLTHASIRSSDPLPAGRTDRQEPGRYRRIDRDDRAVFASAVGAESWKRRWLPPERRAWSARRTEDGAFRIEREPDDDAPRALFGMRPCDLAAARVLDRVLGAGPFPDPAHARRRASTWIVVAQCNEPGGTCFCASMGTGPHADDGFDLALTECLDPGGHRFLVEAGSDRGARLLARLPTRPATDDDIGRARRQRAAAVARMGRSLDVRGLPERLAGATEHPHWARVAERCLACGNCTAVCPTCFCHTVEDRTDLDGARAERIRRWDSCFDAAFSYVHGDSVRAGRASRYRQWATHKFSAWHAQFGTSGCVGCGRCITWCPVGIDVTRELREVLASPAATAATEECP